LLRKLKNKKVDPGSIPLSAGTAGQAPVVSRFQRELRGKKFD